MSTPTYHERLTAPLRWWVQMTMFLATIWLALIVSTPAALAWTAFGACAAIGFGLIGWIGSAPLVLADGALRAGRARIPVDLLGPAEALDVAGTRHALGVGADARAFLLSRPYLKESVRVPVTDRADPTPYWLLSTRHPARLAAALDEALAGATPGPAPDGPDPGPRGKHVRDHLG